MSESDPTTARPCQDCGKTKPILPGPTTRPGCIECVEKHLGAACVLLGEWRAGYHGHYIRAIGHLHEAEDESQPWPAVHAAIREARREFQRRYTVPDFDALALLLAQARQAQAG